MNQELFEKYAREDPKRLVEIIEDGLVPCLLTYAAEALGLARESGDLAAPVLCRLLQHKTAYVREGALYGLAAFPGREDVLEAVRTCAEQDENPAIRAMARGTLDDLV